MNSQNKQQSTNEIQKELSEDLKNSEVGVAEDNSLDLHSSIDPNQIQSNNAGKDNAGKDQQAKDLSQVMLGKRNLEGTCWSVQLQDWVRCP
ncbi:MULTISPECIES: hypothetical protein [unclassified Nostoc]|uniref:hypothetical protein n=1 Tax=unclassified Nostoc TaxID=2593658 RepID=UPI0025D0180B|nr:hypothetical protein [Nostoc sp. JL31]MBN3889862.1 hypothetical protein [Nostoc sp. JL31]